MQPVFTKIKLSISSTLNYVLYFKIILAHILMHFPCPLYKLTISAWFFVNPNHRSPSNVEADPRCECVVLMHAAVSVLSTSDKSSMVC